jgi:hypothetical protein
VPIVSMMQATDAKIVAGTEKGAEAGEDARHHGPIPAPALTA